MRGPYILPTIFLAGATLLLVFNILCGATTHSVLGRWYWLEADTSEISGARPITRWTNYAGCGVRDGRNYDCSSKSIAYPMSPVLNFGTSQGVPSGLRSKRGTIYFLIKVGWVFLLLGLIFTILSFLPIMISFSVPSVTTLNIVSSMTTNVALVFTALSAALLTAGYIKARNAFKNDGKDTSVGNTMFGFIWSSVLLLMLSSFFCGAGCLGNFMKKRKDKKRITTGSNGFAGDSSSSHNTYGSTRNHEKAADNGSATSKNGNSGGFFSRKIYDDTPPKQYDERSATYGNDDSTAYNKPRVRKPPSGGILDNGNSTSTTATHSRSIQPGSTSKDQMASGNGSDCQGKLAAGEGAAGIAATTGVAYANRSHNKENASQKRMAGQPIVQNSSTTSTNYGQKKSINPVPENSGVEQAKSSAVSDYTKSNNPQHPGYTPTQITMDPKYNAKSPDQTSKGNTTYSSHYSDSKHHYDGQSANLYDQDRGIAYGDAKLNKAIDDYHGKSRGRHVTVDDGSEKEDSGFNQSLLATTAAAIGFGVAKANSGGRDSENEGKNKSHTYGDTSSQGNTYDDDTRHGTVPRDATYSDTTQQGYTNRNVSSRAVIGNYDESGKPGLTAHDTSVSKSQREGTSNIVGYNDTGDGNRGTSGVDTGKSESGNGSYVRVDTTSQNATSLAPQPISKSARTGQYADEQYVDHDKSSPAKKTYGAASNQGIGQGPSRTSAAITRVAGAGALASGGENNFKRKEYDNRSSPDHEEPATVYHNNTNQQPAYQSANSRVSDNIFAKPENASVLHYENKATVRPIGTAYNRTKELPQLPQHGQYGGIDQQGKDKQYGKNNSYENSNNFGGANHYGEQASHGQHDGHKAASLDSAAGVDGLIDSQKIHGQPKSSEEQKRDIGSGQHEGYQIYGTHGKVHSHDQYISQESPDQPDTRIDHYSATQKQAKLPTNEPIVYTGGPGAVPSDADLSAGYRPTKYYTQNVSHEPVKSFSRTQADNYSHQNSYDLKDRYKDASGNDGHAGLASRTAVITSPQVLAESHTSHDFHSYDYKQQYLDSVGGPSKLHTSKGVDSATSSAANPRTSSSSAQLKDVSEVSNYHTPSEEKDYGYGHVYSASKRIHPNDPEGKEISKRQSDPQDTKPMQEKSKPGLLATGLEMIGLGGGSKERTESSAGTSASDVVADSPPGCKKSSLEDVEREPSEVNRNIHAGEIVGNAEHVMRFRSTDKSKRANNDFLKYGKHSTAAAAAAAAGMAMMGPVPEGNQKTEKTAKNANVADSSKGNDNNTSDVKKTRHRSKSVTTSDGRLYIYNKSTGDRLINDKVASGGNSSNVGDRKNYSADDKRDYVTQGAGTKYSEPAKRGIDSRRKYNPARYQVESGYVSDTSEVDDNYKPGLWEAGVAFLTGSSLKSSKSEARSSSAQKASDYAKHATHNTAGSDSIYDPANERSQNYGVGSSKDNQGPRKQRVYKTDTVVNDAAEASKSKPFKPTAGKGSAGRKSSVGNAGAGAPAVSSVKLSSTTQSKPSRHTHDNSISKTPSSRHNESTQFAGSPEASKMKSMYSSDVKDPDGYADNEYLPGNSITSRGETSHVEDDEGSVGDRSGKPGIIATGIAYLTGKDITPGATTDPHNEGGNISEVSEHDDNIPTPYRIKNTRRIDADENPLVDDITQKNNSDHTRAAAVGTTTGSPSKIAMSSTGNKASFDPKGHGFQREAGNLKSPGGYTGAKNNDNSTYLGNPLARANLDPNSDYRIRHTNNRLSPDDNLVDQVRRRRSVASGLGIISVDDGKRASSSFEDDYSLTEKYESSTDHVPSTITTGQTGDLNVNSRKDQGFRSYTGARNTTGISTNDSNLYAGGTRYRPASKSQRGYLADSTTATTTTNISSSSNIYPSNSQDANTAAAGSKSSQRAQYNDEPDVKPATYLSGTTTNPYTDETEPVSAIGIDTTTGSGISGKFGHSIGIGSRNRFDKNKMSSGGYNANRATTPEPPVPGSEEPSSPIKSGYNPGISTVAGTAADSSGRNYKIDRSEVSNRNSEPRSSRIYEDEAGDQAPQQTNEKGTAGVVMDKAKSIV